MTSREETKDLIAQAEGYKDWAHLMYDYIEHRSESPDRIINDLMFNYAAGALEAQIKIAAYEAEAVMVLHGEHCGCDSEARVDKASILNCTRIELT